MAEERRREPVGGEIVPAGPVSGAPPEQRRAADQVFTPQTPAPSGAPPPAAAAEVSAAATAGGVIGAALVVMLAACGAGALGAGVGLFGLYGLGEPVLVLQAAVLSGLIVGAHAATCVWAVRVRPPRREVLLTQAPFVLAYVALVPWWFVEWSPLYFAWAVAAGSALAWLLIWYLRGERSSRRSVALLAALAVLVVVNAAGVGAVVWRATNGLGLRGYQTPWAALMAVTASSCIFAERTYVQYTRDATAKCPSGREVASRAGEHDESVFDDAVCSDQPRAAFDRWWRLARQEQYFFTFNSTFDRVEVDGREMTARPTRIDGSAAVMELAVRLELATPVDPVAPERMRADRVTERWVVRAESVALGGWKICEITVADPITPTFVPG